MCQYDINDRASKRRSLLCVSVVLTEAMTIAGVDIEYETLNIFHDL